MENSASVLVLDSETIADINTMLARLCHGALDQVHGQLTIDIVKGEFHEIHVLESFRCAKRRKRKNTRVAQWQSKQR